MPSSQTEELFKLVLNAATEPSADDDAWSAPTPKHEAVDLGEAGRQEIWETGAARIEKLVAKHGGKRFPAHHKENQGVGVLVARFGSSRSHLGDRRYLAIIRGLPKTLVPASALFCCLRLRCCN